MPMATVKYYPAMPSDMMLPPDQGGVLLYRRDVSAELTCQALGDTIVITGHNFVYRDDALVGGTATEFLYKAGGTLNYYRITDIALDLSLGVPTDRSILFSGDDTIVGSYDRDRLFGEAGDDNIKGGKGKDYLIGGEGGDILKGGGGSDIFVFSVTDGLDTISDFDTSGRNKDLLYIRGEEGSSDLKMSQRGADVIIEFSPDNKIVLQNVDLQVLSPDSFHFY